MIAGPAGSGAALAALAGPARAGSRQAFDAVLDRDGRSRGGAKGFRTLAAALDAAPADGARPFRILVTAGTWREQLTVAKPNIHLVGEGGRSSIIVFNEYAAGRNRPGGPAEIATGHGHRAGLPRRAPDHRQRLRLSGPHAARGDYDRTGASGAQATALKLGEGSDRACLRTWP
jgi:pectinesterase